MTRHRTAADSVPWYPPRPNRLLMRTLGRLNRWLMLQWHFRIEELEFPKADRERLARVVKPDTAAFLAPNHPEFGLDWMMDKEISTIVAPRMAAWAAHEIIRGAPWFWTRNNLVSNRGGRAAFDYSVDWALAGNGVLLHPEGMVRWTSDVVHPLFPGVAEMACEAARRAERGDGRPVYIVPLVWKYRHTADISAELHADMTRIERALGLAPASETDVAERFVALQRKVLAKQIMTFTGTHERADDWLGTANGQSFFDSQESFREELVDGLVATYGVPRGASIEQTIHRIGKAVTTSDDRARVREAARLGGFCRDVYDTPWLTQEQIAESLKRLRADLMRDGIRNKLHNLLPPPYGPRVAHVRAPLPIRVTGETEVGPVLADTRRELQRTLDLLTREIAPQVEGFRRRNPLHRLRPARESRERLQGGIDTAMVTNAETHEERA